TPECRAAVPHQVDLDVAAAAVELEVALALAVRRILAAREYRHERGKEMVADPARELEAAIEAAFVQIVVEDPADAARLVAVLEEEVFVAPFLVTRVHVVAERRERLGAWARQV